MEDNFFLQVEHWPKWKILQQEIRDDSDLEKLSFYDLVQVVVDEKDRPIKLKEEFTGIHSYFIFTKTSDFKTKTIMLGELVHQVSDTKEIQNIKINPELFKNHLEQEVYTCDEVIFSPRFDELSKKYIMSDPEDARALFAINPMDQERFGLEIVFYILTNRLLPDEREERAEVLQEKIEELAFMASRIPIKQGSGSLFCVMLNLENEMEEKAFIRVYKTFDSYSDTVFVTSKLELLSGMLDPIEYDGEHIDSIFLPLIEWQKEQQLKI